MVDPDETTAGTGASESSGPWGAGALVGDGRYRLTGRLGRGGMAEVFSAEDVRLGRIVAVKLLRTDLAEDPVAKARFTREAQAVAGLNHHAVVAVYDSGEDRTPTGPVPYMVMELVEGHTIKELLTGPTPPPVDQALLIVSGVLDALAYSHRAGIVHRDIKPANVIITSTGAVKVMDFGIARALHGAASTMTQTGMVMGTPQYLSPEQALGKTVDHRSDLYATGCLLYELLTLRPPFVGETPLSVVYQHVQDDPVIASQLNDRVPPELDGLVLHALAKQPEDRFQSAEEMRDVVGYAHQALTQLGGWTGGRWDTGVLPAAASRMTGTAPTIVQQGKGNGTTSQFPAPLLGTPAGTGRGDDEHGYGERPPGGSGNPWLKPVLFVIAAIVAIALGVFLATRGQGDGGGTPSSSTSPSATQDDTTGQPSDQPSDEPTGSVETSTAPTDTQTDTPTGTPTTTAPTAPTTAPPTTATTAPTTTPPVKPTTTPPVTPTATDTGPTAEPSGGVLGGTSGG